MNEALASGLHVVVSQRAGVVPSVSHMRGVYAADPTPAALALQLKASRDQWNGPILDPEMLRHTLEADAESVLQAIRLAEKLTRAQTSSSSHAVGL